MLSEREFHFHVKSLNVFHPSSRGCSSFFLPTPLLDRANDCRPGVHHRSSRRFHPLDSYYRGSSGISTIRLHSVNHFLFGASHLRHFRAGCIVGKDQRDWCLLGTNGGFVSAMRASVCVHRMKISLLQIGNVFVHAPELVFASNLNYSPLGRSSHRVVSIHPGIRVFRPRPRLPHRRRQPYSRHRHPGSLPPLWHHPLRYRLRSHHRNFSFDSTTRSKKHHQHDILPTL